MAIGATFIGINKHLDPNIRELTGAGRDATALSAFFADSIAGLSAELLIDVETTIRCFGDGMTEKIQHGDLERPS